MFEASNDYFRKLFSDFYLYLTDDLTWEGFKTLISNYPYVFGIFAVLVISLVVSRDLFNSKSLNPKRITLARVQSKDYKPTRQR